MNILLDSKNPDHFHNLLTSKICKEIDSKSLEYLFRKVDDKIQYVGVSLIVFADGFVVYSEDGLNHHKTMYLKNPKDTSEYSGVISDQSLFIYKALLQSCLEAEHILAPKGFVPKEYSVGLQIKRTLWGVISYTVQYRKR